jgi:hypothetical protein
MACSTEKWEPSARQDGIAELVSELFGASRVSPQSDGDVRIEGLEDGDPGAEVLARFVVDRGGHVKGAWTPSEQAVKAYEAIRDEYREAEKASWEYRDPDDDDGSGNSLREQERELLREQEAGFVYGGPSSDTRDREGRPTVADIEDRQKSLAAPEGVVYVVVGVTDNEVLAVSSDFSVTASNNWEQGTRVFVASIDGDFAVAEIER